MNAELSLYSNELKRQLDRLCKAVEPLSEAQLNWRPPAPGANSPYAIVAHVLGNIEAWVLGIACEEPLRRDRPAEFASSGPDAAALTAKARELIRRLEAALAALPPDALDQSRHPSQEHWGEGQPEPVTVRAALMHTTEHAAMHYGQLQTTTDLLSQTGISA